MLLKIIYVNILRLFTFSEKVIVQINTVYVDNIDKMDTC